VQDQIEIANRLRHNPGSSYESAFEIGMTALIPFPFGPTTRRRD